MLVPAARGQQRVGGLRPGAPGPNLGRATGLRTCTKTAPAYKVRKVHKGVILNPRFQFIFQSKAEKRDFLVETSPLILSILLGALGESHQRGRDEGGETSGHSRWGTGRAG